MAVDWEANCKKKWKQIRELAWRGVPNPMRTLVWPLLAGVRSTEDSLKTRYPQLLAVSLGNIVARGDPVCNCTETFFEVAKQSDICRRVIRNHVHQSHV